MQIKIFTIPIHGGETVTDDLNAFLRSKKVLQVEQQLLPQEGSACWCFSIKYIEDVTIADRDRLKVDYKQMLDEASFLRFSKMREIRKEIAQVEAIPAYAVFSDGELASLAKIEHLTPVAVAGADIIRGSASGELSVFQNIRAEGTPDLRQRFQRAGAPPRADERLPSAFRARTDF